MWLQASLGKKKTDLQDAMHILAVHNWITRNPRIYHLSCFLLKIFGSNNVLLKKLLVFILRTAGQQIKIFFQVENEPIHLVAFDINICEVWDFEFAVMSDSKLILEPRKELQA